MQVFGFGGDTPPKNLKLFLAKPTFRRLSRINNCMKEDYHNMQTAIKAFQFVCYSLGIIAYALAIWHYTH